MDLRYQTRRAPGWSQHLTDPAARLLPRRWYGRTLIAIKVIHTVLFVSIGAAIALFAWDGIRAHPRRRTAYALGIALGETAVYVSNNQVCPLTPLAEQFGTESGSVVDIFLPDAVARRIPVVSGTALVLGLALNGRALIARRHHLARNGGGDG
ncbi:MAG TPA: hypothetical protein VFQ46_11965 [Candidatus Limnocylindria bacterium]|nr:hypothetical protein [Candidatus Limnocylindria bacterium]